jgi:hypothetical protein
MTKQIMDPCWAIQNPSGAFPTDGIFVSNQERKRILHPKLTKAQIASSERVRRKQAARYDRGEGLSITNTIPNLRG